MLWFVFFMLFYLMPSKHMGPSRSNELILFEGIIPQSLLFIEAPEMDLSRFGSKEFSMLPPLYHSLPSILPMQVSVFLEKRNQLIYQFSKNYLVENSLNLFKSPFDDLDEIIEIIPVSINGIEAVAIITPDLYLFDQNLIPLDINLFAPFNDGFLLDGVILSARFPDRFWMQYSSSDTEGIQAFIRKVTMEQTLVLGDPLFIVDTVQNSIPIQSVALSDVQTDPQVHLSKTSILDIIYYSGVLSMWAIIMWWLIQWSQKHLFRANTKVCR